jgi:hypothetical protein
VNEEEKQSKHQNVAQGEQEEVKWRVEEGKLILQSV